MTTGQSALKLEQSEIHTGEPAIVHGDQPLPVLDRALDLSDIDMSQVSHERPALAEIAPSAPYKHVPRDVAFASFVQSVQNAHMIAWVRVSAVTQSPLELGAGQSPSELQTLATLELVQAVRGDKAPTSIAFAGGMVAGRRIRSSHDIFLETGITYLLILDANRPTIAVRLDNGAVWIAGFLVSRDALTEALR